MTATLEAQRQQLRRTLAAQVAAAFAALEDYQRPEVFIQPTVATVRGAQTALAEAIAVAAAAQATSALGRPIAPPRLPTGAVTDLRGVDPAEVYHRPFATLWTELGRGRWFRHAREQAAQRVQGLIEGDVQLTYGHAWRESMQRLPEGARPRYWRRVTQGDYTCGLCLIAATNRYRRGDLNPMHPGCDCAVRPVYGTDTFDEDAAYARAHEAIRELTGQSSRRARGYHRYLIREHGELGPMLANPTHEFTTADELAA